MNESVIKRELNITLKVLEEQYDNSVKCCDDQKQTNKNDVELRDSLKVVLDYIKDIYSDFK